MDVSTNQKRLIEVDLSYLDDFLEIYNESRHDWRVYFAPLTRERLIDTINLPYEKCLYGVSSAGVMLGYIVCYLHDYYSNGITWIAHHETILVSKSRCKSGYTMYKVTEMLVDALIAWAKMKKATRIVWASGTGSWRGFQHILMIRNARQIGVVLDTEL